MTAKRMPQAVPLSRVTAVSRAPETVLCYDGVYADGTHQTWRDFLADTAKMRNEIRRHAAADWILHCEDAWYFLCAFTALLQLQKHILLCANISPAYIAEIRAAHAGTVAFLTDQPIADSVQAAEVLHHGDASGAETPPAIVADDTVIILYTSGSTGVPKAVRQRLTEFENDNAFILSQWGDELLTRTFCSTVSQHHIYGLLFSILLPFTAGIPFRRTRITYPEALTRFTDTPYAIITVPAFLKRAAEILTGDDGAPAPLPLVSPWIFTSGGVLPPDIAAKTDALFGFWPLEVYGSTETSGIAYRRSRDGLAWTPFANASVWKNADGCLVVRSPYIRDSAGFTTGDLVDMLDDGRFVLNGRADSVVKIEEKRISLPEVEARLKQSDLAADVCVIALTGLRERGDGRQYLAAALVLNAAGKERFADAEKHDVNRFFREYLGQFFEPVVIPKRWRYVDSLPLDPQGKKKKADIESLFVAPPPAVTPPMRAIPAGISVRALTHTDTQVVLELHISADCAYFDGHFPAFKLLPAVAQFELVVRLASQYWGTGIAVPKATRLKFTRPIRPDSTVRMELVRNADSVTYKITAPADAAAKAYASGTLTLGDAA